MSNPNTPTPETPPLVVSGVGVCTPPPPPPPVASKES